MSVKKPATIWVHPSIYAELQAAGAHLDDVATDSCVMRDKIFSCFAAPEDQERFAARAAELMDDLRDARALQEEARLQAAQDAELLAGKEAPVPAPFVQLTLGKPQLPELPETCGLRPGGSLPAPTFESSFKLNVGPGECANFELGMAVEIAGRSFVIAKIDRVNGVVSCTRLAPVACEFCGDEDCDGKCDEEDFALPPLMGISSWIPSGPSIPAAPLPFFSVDRATPLSFRPNAPKEEEEAPRADYVFRTGTFDEALAEWTEPAAKQIAGNYRLFRTTLDEEAAAQLAPVAPPPPPLTPCFECRASLRPDQIAAREPDAAHGERCYCAYCNLHRLSNRPL